MESEWWTGEGGQNENVRQKFGRSKNNNPIGGHRYVFMNIPYVRLGMSDAVVKNGGGCSGHKSV